jgi:hypothetical protein
MKAVCEWAAGDFIDLSSPSNQSVMDLENFGSRITTKLIANKICDSNSWQEFQIRISQDSVVF